MKKSIWTVLLSALVALLAVGCAKEADLSDLKNKVSDLDKRVTALEDAIDEINKETIPGLKNLVDAVNNKITIQSVVEGDGEYTINFTDGTSAVIKNGNDGEDGDDAEAPVISITLGEDGIYYWTVNGQLMKDEAGNPLPVTAKGDKGDKGETGDKGEDGDKGDKGEDGITPLFGTSSEGKVIVSYDNGETWKPLGFSVIDGSAFTSAYIDENKSTEDYIVLVVGETEVQIPKEKTFSLKITYDGKLNSVGINAGETIALEYAVQGVSSTDEVTVDILSATAGITAKIAAVDAVSGYIMISVPAADPEATEPAKIEGKIFVFADNNKGKSNIKVISLEKGEIAAVADVSAQAPAAGGEFELTVTTNKEYNVNVNDEAASWLSVVETKATHTDKLKIVAAKNETGAYRVGTVTINDRNTADKIEEFTVVQQPSAEVATDIASVRELEDGAPVFVKDAIVLAATKSGVLVGDANGGYVYVPLKDNLAVVRGDVVSFSGVKKTAETPAITYVEVESIEDDDYEGEIPDLMWMYYGFAAQMDASTSIHTTFVANMSKDAETGAMIATPFYGQSFIVVDPMSSYDVEAFDGKLVTIEGYTNGGVVTDESEAYSFMLTGIKELSYTVNPNWTLSFDPGTQAITNTVSGGDENEWYGFIVVKAEMVGAEASYATIEEMIQDALPYSSDDIQYTINGEYAGYPTSLIINYILEDSIMQGTGSMAFDIPYGKYIAIAYGMEDGTFNLTGNYATLEFEYADPHVPAAYDEFLGDWVVGSSKWTVTEKENGVSYSIAGGLGSTGLIMTANYKDGAMEVVESAYENTLTSSYGTVENVIIGGGFSEGTTNYWGYQYLSDDVINVIMTVGKLDDGSFDVTGGDCFVTYESGETGTEPFTYYGVWGILGDDAGQYAGRVITMVRNNIPSSIEKYIPDTTEYFFKADFEDASCLDDWTLIDADGDGNKWYFINTLGGHASTGMITSASYSGTALQPDNWAFTPQIELSSESNFLSFWVCAQDASYPKEHYAVYVTKSIPTSGKIEDGCEVLIPETVLSANGAPATEAMGAWKKQIVEVPASLKGEKVYFGFRHFNCTDWFRINIDDVALSEVKPATSATPTVFSVTSSNTHKGGHAVAKSVNFEKKARVLKTSDSAPAKKAVSHSLKARKAVVNGVRK